MQYVPARRALAGSVLVLGSVGTVSGVHLDSVGVPAGSDGRPSAALAPSAGPGIPGKAPDVLTPAPAAPSASHAARPSARVSSRSADRPVTGRDLIDIAHGPRGGGSVVFPVHDIERTVPLRSTPGTGRRGLLGTGLRSLDDLLDVEDAPTSGRGRRALDDRYGARYVDRDYRAAGHRWDDRWDDGSDRFNAGAHRADVSWSDDVRYSPSRCGRHRA